MTTTDPDTVRADIQMAHAAAVELAAAVGSETVRDDMQTAHTTARALSTTLDSPSRWQRLRARVGGPAQLQARQGKKIVVEARARTGTVAAMAGRAAVTGFSWLGEGIVVGARAVAAAWPLVVAGVFTTLLWLAYGLPYFETTLWSWPSAVALYGSHVMLFVVHRTLAERSGFYRFVRYTGGVR